MVFNGVNITTWEKNVKLWCVVLLHFLNLSRHEKESDSSKIKLLEFSDLPHPASACC